MSNVSGESLVGQLVAQRPARARIFENLGIDYCCGGGQPLAQACAARKLELSSVLAACASWPGVRRVRRVLEFSDQRSESVLESCARVTFDERGLPPPELQVNIGGDEIIGRVDFFRYGWQPVQGLNHPAVATGGDVAVKPSAPLASAGRGERPGREPLGGGVRLDDLDGPPVAPDQDVLTVEPLSVEPMVVPATAEIAPLQVSNLEISEISAVDGSKETK